MARRVTEEPLPVEDAPGKEEREPLDMPLEHFMPAAEEGGTGEEEESSPRARQETEAARTKPSRKKEPTKQGDEEETVSADTEQLAQALDRLDESELERLLGKTKAKAILARERQKAESVRFKDVEERITQRLLQQFQQQAQSGAAQQYWQAVWNELSDEGKQYLQYALGVYQTQLASQLQPQLSQQVATTFWNQIRSGLAAIEAAQDLSEDDWREIESAPSFQEAAERYAKRVEEKHLKPRLQKELEKAREALEAELRAERRSGRWQAEPTPPAEGSSTEGFDLGITEGKPGQLVAPPTFGGKANEKDYERLLREAGLLD